MIWLGFDMWEITYTDYYETLANKGWFLLLMFYGFAWGIYNLVKGVIKQIKKEAHHE